MEIPIPVKMFFFYDETGPWNMLTGAIVVSSPVASTPCAPPGGPHSGKDMLISP